MLKQKITFTYTGADQVFTVPNAVSEVFIQTWGAAGGASRFVGGPGGYSQGTLNVNPYDNLTVIVGQGGIPYTVNQTTCTLPTYGGGGGGGLSVEQFRGASGGGRSAVRLSDSTEVITAGGGGGSSSSYFDTGVANGGSGGGNTGYSAICTLSCYSIALGKGGTQSTGGIGGSGWTAFNYGTIGSQFIGGNGGGGSNGGASAGSGGGGGGGYFGGGGGAGEFQAGSGCPISATTQDCPGGGGSGYIGGVSLGLTLATTITATNVASINPPFTTDPNYVTGVGVSTNSAIGGNGLVVFTYSLPTLSKYVDKPYATIGDTITYTLVLDNLSGVTLTNILFVDTIPTGTTFVNNSLNVNNNPISGSPNPPGISLGDIETEITITFSVVVSTLPSPNTISNFASIAADNFTTANSNSVTTTLNYLILSSLKEVSKNYADIGYILTYTIPITNSGNSTATNILFLDTLPSSVSLVPNSFKQDGVVVTGSPNFPGATLPNSIRVNRTSTVTFQVQILTLPNPNPILNSATATGNFIVDSSTTPNISSSNSTNTNIVSTTVNTVSLGNIQKFVDSAFSTCGNTIAYTIVVPNSGNVTALSVFITDTLANGLLFVPGSMLINNLPSSSTPSLINVGTIPTGNTATITFIAKVNC